MQVRTFARPLGCALVLSALLSAGCAKNDGGDQGSGLAVSFTAPSPGAGSDVVFLRERGESGNVLVLDVIGRNIAPPVDGLDLAIAFDPGVAEAFGALSQTFLGTCGRTRPDNTQLICQDNIKGDANQTGVLLFSAYPSGGSPTPEIIAGDRVLATISFRAVAPGSGSIDFFVRTRPSPGTASYSRVTSAADPNGAAAVEFEPDLPGVAAIKVVRER